jgi:hypothetical protein
LVNFIGVRNLLIISFLLLIGKSIIGQEASDGQFSIPFKAVIHWKYMGNVEVFKKPNGKCLKTIKNDSTIENYISIIVNKTTKDFFKCKLYFEVTGDTISGWIEKQQYVGATIKKESYPMKLQLYSKPKETIDYLIELNEWNPSFVTIEDCDGYWALISITYKGKRKTGWIRYDKLCANNYSSCN